MSKLLFSFVSKGYGPKRRCDAGCTSADGATGQRDLRLPPGRNAISRSSFKQAPFAFLMSSSRRHRLEARRSESIGVAPRRRKLSRCSAS